MSKQWFSVAEIVGLPGMPSSSFGVRKRSKSEGWECRKKAKGKGFEFHISNFPEETRGYLAKLEVEQLCKTDPAAIAGRELVAQMEAEEKAKKKGKQAVKAKSLMAFNSLPEDKQTKANARLFIVKARETYLVPYAEISKITVGEKLFVTEYNDRELALEPWVYETVSKISCASCRRWQKQLDEQGLARLAGDYSANKRPGIVEQQQELQNYLIAVITGKPHLANRPNVLLRMVNEKHEQYPHWVVPSASSIGRWLSKWKADNIAKFAYLTNPDAYNSKHRPLFAKMYPWLQAPNDCWEFDSTPTDVQLRVKGKLVRYSIIAAIDVYTRRAKLLLSPSSNSEGICLLLRKCLMDWGMLNDGGIARTDNGSDYVSKRVSAVFEMLAFDQSKANAFSGWEKPYIERFFGTLSQGLLELLPGYIGHSVSDRQQIEAAKAFAQRIGEGKKKAQQEALELALTPDELEEVMNDWLEHRYNHTSHEGLDGKTPFQMYSESGYRPRLLADEHSLDYLLNYVGEATVIRGRISAGNVKYTAPELMNSEWDRKRVRVFLDPNDVGRAMLYPLDNWDSFIEAVNVDLVGRSIDPAAFREQRKQQTKALSDFRRSSKKLQQEFGIDTQYAEALAADKARNNLKAFSHQGELSDNAAIEALTKAAQHKPKSVERSDEELERLEKAKEALLRREESINQQKGLVIRNIHDKARYLAEQTLSRELTEKEVSFLEDYKRNNPFGRKTVEEIMARRRQA
ncbi:DNA-binding protein [Photobacterium atrarenae]|uniref:Mu transposase C-terminal domain-containing protein n=1 Tax=Photobacterium atrarenae TaxID=865757 RepID=A0ABY5GM80_9GAMM|nr:DNA-binding protein [Photobacterium atrarenae]UTV30195.1 Mu transposase C-terminal domain-containing protein [Photobacterium atrarenae]